MPRCKKCHSQWASLLRCPHCETKFPCPLQLFLVSVTLPLIVAAAIYVLSSFSHKVEDWRSLEDQEAPAEKSLTIEIDRSSVE